MPDSIATSPTRELYYVSPMLLSAGTIIPPGNFGKNILSQTPSQGRNGWPVVRELIFEQVRIKMAAHLPSRLHCNFLFPNAASAKHGSKELGAEVLSPSIYSVELVEPDQPECMGDYNAIKTINESRFIDSAHDAAVRYWHAATANQLKEGYLPELLTLSPIRIISSMSRQILHPLVFPVIGNVQTKGSLDLQAPAAEHSDLGCQT